MPPKGSRGGVRGRGRGRGKATASAVAELAADVPMTGTGDGPASQSILEASPPSAAEPPATKITTPQNILEDDFAPSPNSSPATVPTETPAPTPVRAPLQRTESTGSGSVPPATRGGRGGARGRGKNAAESRFKPKNVRRDAGELQELAQKEQARLAGIAQGRVREEARASRGRGRPPRGRGDVMGRGAGVGRGAATGVFSVVPEAMALNPGFVKMKSGGGGGSGSRSAPASGSIVKKDPGPSSGSGGGGSGGGGGGGGSGARSEKTFIPEPEYPDEDGDAPRVDIELINLVSDSEEDEKTDDLAVLGSRLVSKPHQANKYGLKPIRLHREEHKDRVSQVSTEPAVKPAPESDSEDLPTIDELRSTGDRHKGKDGKGVYRDLGEEVRVKTEPGLEFSRRESITEASQIPIAPPSPKSKRKAKAQVLASSSAIDLDSEHEENATPAVHKDRKARRHSKKKDVKPVLQTDEDKAEWERHLEDMDVLAKELGGLQGNLNLSSHDDEGDFTMSDGPREKDPGRIYLFQFPPVLPELYNPLTSQKPKPKGSVKTEKEDEKDKGEGKGKGKGKDPDVDMTGMSAGAKAKSKGKQTVDLTETAVKIEEDVISTDAAVKHAPDGSRKKKDEFVHEEGWIGKLIVRESGRVELNWGGTHLLVGRGAEAAFLSNALVVDGIERGPPGGGAPEGKATSMGQVMGKFVVTPDLERST